VVSRVLLRRFTLPVPHNKQGLRKIDLLADPVSSEENGPKGSGKVLDCVPFASASMEDYWGVIENKFHLAFAAIDDGSLFTRPDQLSVVRDMVALHYVRTMQVKQQHFKSFGEALASARTSGASARRTCSGSTSGRPGSSPRTRRRSSASWTFCSRTPPNW